MFVLNRNVSAAYRVIATLVAIAVVMWTIGYYATAQAASVTTFSNVLSDSAPGVPADQLITFTAPTAMAIGETFTITWPAAFDLSSVVIGDIDLGLPGDQTLAGAAGAGAWGWDLTGQVMTFETPTDAGTTAGTTFTVDIGTAAAGTNQIVNPTSPAAGNESYQIAIAGTMTDSGFTRVVILDTIEITANVETIFNFRVYGNTTGGGADVNGETTTITSSSTTIPFGTLTSGVPQVLSQDLTVETNAFNGFVVTVETDQSLLSSTGADIDNFVDNVIGIPATWEAPSVGLDVTDENTWGFWGITSEDADLNSDEFGLNLWAGVTSTPRQVFSHGGPADQVTPNIGSTTVGFKVEISALQEAGDDYSTTLTYIATPTF